MPDDFFQLMGGNANVGGLANAYFQGAAQAAQARQAASQAAIAPQVSQAQLQALGLANQQAQQQIDAQAQAVRDQQSFQDDLAGYGDGLTAQDAATLMVRHPQHFQQIQGAYALKSAAEQDAARKTAYDVYNLAQGIDGDKPETMQPLLDYYASRIQAAEGTPDQAHWIGLYQQAQADPDIARRQAAFGVAITDPETFKLIAAQDKPTYQTVSQGQQLYRDGQLIADNPPRPDKPEWRVMTWPDGSQHLLELGGDAPGAGGARPPQADTILGPRGGGAPPSATGGHIAAGPVGAGAPRAGIAVPAGKYGFAIPVGNNTPDALDALYRSINAGASGLAWQMKGEGPVGQHVPGSFHYDREAFDFRVNTWKAQGAPESFVPRLMADIRNAGYSVIREDAGTSNDHLHIGLYNHRTPVYPLGRPPSAPRPPQADTSGTPPQADTSGTGRYIAPGVREIYATPPAPPKPGDGAGVPGNMQLTGQAYMASLDPNMRAQVQQILDGRRAVTGFELSHPEGRALIAAANQADPNFDVGNANQRWKTRQAFTVGKQGQTVASINTAISHAIELDRQVDDLGNYNGGIAGREINRIGNWWAGGNNNAKINRFSSNVKAFADEVERAFRGAAGTQKSIEEVQGTLSPDLGPQALHAGIGQYVHLLMGRLQPLQDEYGNGMGKVTTPLELVSPRNQAFVNKYIQGAPGAGQPGLRVPTVAMLNNLRQNGHNPQARARFEKYFGPNSAQRYLGY